MLINRADWPVAGPHRTLLEFLDQVHVAHGCKSVGELSRVMGRITDAPGLAPSRIHTILRGRALPTGVAQTRLIVRAMLDGPDDAGVTEKAADLFAEMRRAELGVRAATRTGNSSARSDDVGARAEAGPETSPPPAPVPRRAPESPAAPRPWHVIGLVVTTAVVVTATMIGGFEVLRPLASTTSIPSPRPTDAPETAAAAPPFAGASVQVDLDDPGACHRNYVVRGTTGSDPRIAGRHLWIVAELYADPLDGDPRAEYYPKKRIPVPSGAFSTRIAANTAPGTRRDRFLLVVSPDRTADQDLQLSLDSDLAGDQRYPDGHRHQLQFGNTEIASTPATDQRC